mgnify:CR=1 FL=1
MKNGQVLHTSPYVTQIENTQILSNSFPDISSSGGKEIRIFQ